MPKSHSSVSSSPFSSLSLYGPMPGEGVDRECRRWCPVRLLSTSRGRVRGIGRMLAGLVWTTAFAAACQWDRWSRFRGGHVYTPVPESGKWLRCTGEKRLPPISLTLPDYIDYLPIRPDPTQPHHGGPLRYTWDGPRWHGAPGSESLHWKVTASRVMSTGEVVPPDFSKYVLGDASSWTPKPTCAPGSPSSSPPTTPGRRGRPRHTRRSWNTWGT